MRRCAASISVCHRARKVLRPSLSTHSLEMARIGGRRMKMREAPVGAADVIEPIEKASADELVALQLQRLKETVGRAYERVAHYRRAFDAAGVHPDDLKDLADIAKFPFTTKDDLRANYPFGMLATPMDDIIRIHASSGTTGKIGR